MSGDGDTFTMPGVYPAIRVGDEFTIAGQFVSVPNPARKWWQLWKPRMVQTENLKRFRVMTQAGAQKGLGE